MKIADLAGQGADFPESKRKVKDRGGVGSSKGVSSSSTTDAAPGFAEAFLNAGHSLTVRALDQILDELGRQGERLAASQNFEELEKYKSLVREFVQKAVKGMSGLKTAEARSGTGKVHVLLRKVDTEMEALTRDVMARQATPLSILSRLDQIRGLLLDLYK
ncbi:MAG: YaaR family protein [bacterium]